MTRLFCYLFLLLTIFYTTAESATGYGSGEQDWGYVDIREGAHMFYWLYYTTANVSAYTERPLTIWLQGGPGASSVGYGNFEELGPLTLEGTPREWTWVKDLNVLFIDNPVGSGYSYVDDTKYFPLTNKEIALDLVEFMKGFYAKHPEFQTVPLHIFCESYGGKMSHEFALELYRAVQRGEVRSNLKSVVLGDPWTSPIDSVMSWGPFLLNMGVVDYAGYNKTMEAAYKVQEMIDQGEWYKATDEWGNAEGVIYEESYGVDFYNVERKTRYTAEPANYVAKLRKEAAVNQNAASFLDLEVNDNRDQLLRDLMVGPVAKALDVKSTWGAQSGAVFTALATDFMKPAVDILVELLETTDVEVGVLTGQLDLICATPGTVNFVEKMQWSYKDKFVAAPRLGIEVNGVLEGYQKSAGKFSFFWANRAGHMVPADNPAAMDYLLRYYTKYDQTVNKDLHPSFL